MNGFFVTGTDTGVGKTIVTASLAAWYRSQGCPVGVIKPVQTGSYLYARAAVRPQRKSRNYADNLYNSEELWDDVEFLRQTSGCNEPAELINPYCLRLPASPHLAARLENIEIEPLKIAGAIKTLSRKYRLVLVEGTGGLMVPYTDNYSTADLIKELKIPILIVARPGVGTINHTMLTVETAKYRGLEVAGIIFNQSESRLDNPPGAEEAIIEEDNKRIIEKLSGIKVWGTIPYDKGICTIRGSLGSLLRKTSHIWDANLKAEQNEIETPIRNYQKDQ